MESLNKAVSWATKMGSSDTVLSVAMATACTVLLARSFGQQKEIEALEAEKASLIDSNKEMKKTMWSWKQSLFAAAESESPPLVPLARLKAIYGDAQTPPPQNDLPGDASKEGENSSSTSKLVV